MPKTSTNIHFEESEKLRFSQCVHGPDYRSITVRADEYGGVSLFINLAQAAQIAEHFKVLCMDWGAEQENAAVEAQADRERFYRIVAYDDLTEDEMDRMDDLENAEPL